MRGGRVWPTAYTHVISLKDAGHRGTQRNEYNKQSFFLDGRKHPNGRSTSSKPHHTPAVCGLKIKGVIITFSTNLIGQSTSCLAGYRQWARPSLRSFILQELNVVECKGLAHETNRRCTYIPFYAEFVVVVYHDVLCNC